MTAAASMSTTAKAVTECISFTGCSTNHPPRRNGGREIGAAKVGAGAQVAHTATLTPLPGTQPARSLPSPRYLIALDVLGRV
jgi:hypothetical protein